MFIATWSWTGEGPGTKQSDPWFESFQVWVWRGPVTIGGRQFTCPSSWGRGCKNLHLDFCHVFQHFRWRSKCDFGAPFPFRTTWRQGGLTVKCQFSFLLLHCFYFFSYLHRFASDHLHVFFFLEDNSIQVQRSGKRLKWWHHFFPTSISKTERLPV